MSNQLVLTVDVEEPYLGAIKAAAAARQIDSIDIVGELSEHSSSTELALAVIEADGDGHDAIERVRAVRKVFHQAPPWFWRTGSVRRRRSGSPAWGAPGS